MLDDRNTFAGKRKYLFVFVLLLFVFVTCMAFRIAGNKDYDIARREVLLRKIGHELLLQSGDGTSRVLPVKKMAENDYQLSLENKFTFQPDSLVNTIRRLLRQDPLTRDYIVNVLNCADSSVAFGFAISQNKTDNIIACSGRKQPAACYMINIKFKPTGSNLVNGYFLGSLPILAFVGFIFFRPDRPKKTSLNEQCSGVITFGFFGFNPAERQLIINQEIINLTGTETRLLLIFAVAPNQIIARSRLQKEIWEDEGIIVGRSLDMFISKIRKKLEPDPGVNIVVVRGKGYKLEIIDQA